MDNKILVIGAAGQIGTELVLKLRSKYGNDNIVAADIKTPNYDVFEEGPFEFLDVLDKERLEQLIKKHHVKIVYNLAALLSATAEKHPEFAWKLNMEGLLNVLELAKNKVIDQIFWPSSIAVFGPTTPKYDTPQTCVMDPTTVYGISKLAGERWCEYYHKKYNVDVRSVRYPGLISYKSQPGGGTTDYAVHIFHEAKKRGSYQCYVSKDTMLPMMYMDDAIDATIGIMEQPVENIKIRSSYNISGVSFNPEELAEEIKIRVPDFTITYAPDYRQEIANSWPSSINEKEAAEDWGWGSKFGLSKMTDVMLSNI
jgi:nucleoside-diphosphate-sugar epimerase